MQVLLFLVIPAAALVCYENDEGTVKEVSNENWEYCVMIPATDDTEARMFGVERSEDNLEAYEASFKKSDAYKVLTVCLLEKYDLSQLSLKSVAPEYLFRCLCAYDRCNSKSTFSGYLSGIRADNA